MFERIDKEEDSEVYLREVVEFLRVLDDNLEQTKEVSETQPKESFMLYLSGGLAVHGVRARGQQSAKL